MGLIATQMNTVWRDYNTAGVPASGIKSPDKAEIRAAMAAIDAVLAIDGSNNLSLPANLAIAKSSGAPTIAAQSVQASGYAAPTMQMSRVGAAGAKTPDSSVLGEVRFDGYDSALAYMNAAMISVSIGTNASGGAPSTMTFLTAASGANASTRMTLDNLGNLGIGAAAPATARFAIETTSGGTNGRCRLGDTTTTGNGASSAIPVWELVGARGDANGTFYGRVALGHRRCDGTAIASTTTIGGILFGGQYGTDQTYQSAKNLHAASIKGVAEGSWTASGAMATGIAFYTGSTGEDAATANGTFGTERIRIDASGNIKPASDNAYTCGASGARWSAVWAANGTIQTSDRRDKTEIRDSDLGLGFIEALRPVSYVWKVGGVEVSQEVDHLQEVPIEWDSDGAITKTEVRPVYRTVETPKPGRRRHYGLIAQEVRAALDAAGVADFGGHVLTDPTDPESQQALRFDELTAPLIRAVQELSAQNRALRARLEKIEAALVAR